MESTISFIQANLQHSIAASSILTRTVSVKGIDLALIQEPWYRYGCVSGLNIPRYTLYSVRGKDRPRACILGRDMNIWELPRFSCRDLVAVLERFEDGAERRLVVCSAYLPYDSEDPPPSRELEELVRYCENEIQLLVGCDSNAHHTAWGSTNCNGRGEALMEFLNSTTLEIFNSSSEPTFCTSVRQEVIDITLGSHGLSDSITDWEVSLEPSLTDHRHILFILRGSTPVLLIRNPRGTNWGFFHGSLREKLEKGPEMSMKDEAGLGLAIHWIQQALISAFEDNCPLQPIRKGRKSRRWTLELELLRREVRRLFNRCQANNDLHSSELYREAQRRYRKEVRKASRETWSTFVSFVNDLPRSARIHRTLSRDPKIKLGSLVALLGWCTQSKGETLDLLLATYFPGSICAEGEVLPAPACRTNCLDWQVAARIVEEWSGQLILLPHTKVQEWMGFFLLYCKREVRSSFLT
jgi:hypothetical protein